VVTRASPGPVAILGAGLSGLSLACALLEENVSDPIVLIDRREAWGRDRTWCTWASETMRFSELASHRWPAWRIVDGDREAVARSPRHPYLHFDSRDVYGEALRRLETASNVELRTGHTVTGLTADPRTGRPVIHANRGEIEATTVYDALGPNSPLLRGQPRGEIELVQSFLGWDVEVEKPIFDPGMATLMDFRSDSHHGLRFLYVLPFSSTRALIEDTSIGRAGATAAERRALLEEELAARSGGAGWQVHHEERGVIPMSTRSFKLHRGAHVHAVGAAAGSIRPSSGYAFSRIQRHCSLVARAHARAQPFPTRVTPARVSALDAIFLRALDTDPQRFPEVFLRLAGRVPGDVFARFMTDLSTPAEDARVIAALPKAPFLAALARSVRARR
jgi:lycopene beta-cyclase